MIILAIILFGIGISVISICGITWYQDHKFIQEQARDFFKSGESG